MPAQTATTGTLRLLAPAKLNLFLHITGRRADGYHELQTVFQLLDYGDTLLFTLPDRPSYALHVEWADTLAAPAGGTRAALPMERNLITRAMHLLRQRAGPDAPGVHIRVHKRIPAGAGLGGGSANAAMTLLALNHLWQLALDAPTLCTLGALLGADVPVFIQGQSAWAEGIGDRLTPVQLPPAWYVVITPACSVATGGIFCHEDLTRNTPAIKMADFLAGGVRNDCEPVTCRLYPEVAEALAWLRQFGAARMTGTGASVFASFADAASAQRVLQELPDTWRGFVAKGVNTLPRNLDIQAPADRQI